MHLQPNRNYRSNDDVQTPLPLARQIVAHFQPRGRILEPCIGKGNIRRALQARLVRAHPAPAAPARRHGATSIDWCEIKRGRNFFAWQEHVDWVITNPPWSQFRAFLQHALALADEVVFLVTINHLWTQARIRDITTAGFGVREIVMVATPATFPPLGFQLGVVHLSRGWAGSLALTDWRANTKTEDFTTEPSTLLAPTALAAQPGLQAAKTGRSAPRARPKAARRTASTAAFPSAWMSGRELAALSPQEHLRLILRAA